MNETRTRWETDEQRQERLARARGIGDLGEPDPDAIDRLIFDLQDERPGTPLTLSSIAHEIMCGIRGVHSFNAALDMAANFLFRDGPIINPLGEPIEANHGHFERRQVTEEYRGGPDPDDEELIDYLEQNQPCRTLEMATYLIGRGVRDTFDDALNMTASFIHRNAGDRIGEHDEEPGNFELI